MNKPAISNLFNESLLPLICQQLLGTKAPGKQGQGQVALRFPGDLCQSDTSHSSPAHFEALRKHWHIDGCASDAISGVTDHWGEIKNFDALVGVLLMDVIEPMSGELCYYPGSHYALGDYFKDHGLKDIYAKGSAGLPNGQCTDDLFLRPAEHCIGKAGDAFLANYLTAHFVAPNTSPYIRYAVYFRVRGVAFNDSTVPVQHVGESMLEPWINWPCMDTIVL